jgi:hypothetical protein
MSRWFPPRLTHYPRSLLRKHLPVIEFHQHSAACILFLRAARNQLVITVVQVLRHFLNNLDLAN